MKIKSLLSVCVVIMFSSAFAGAGEVDCFSVDFSKAIGSVKRLNGICNSPMLSNSRKSDTRKLFNALEPPYVRFHDAAHESPGFALIDVSRLFPLFHADVDDPENYDFEATDDYLKWALESGAKLEFRLGESIEHAPQVYRVRAPKDYAKWTEICAHIIRHYNEGWGKNGKHWNIEHWTIWEEPTSIPQLWSTEDSDYDESMRKYYDLYCVAAVRLKKEFPNLKFGPALGAFEKQLREFVDYCAERHAPIDFYAWTTYPRSPNRFFDEANLVRKVLDDQGYKHTKLSIAEWHIGPMSWRGHGDANPSKRFSECWSAQLTGTESGVFAAATLIKMQDAPIDMMYFYSWAAGHWGLVNRGGLPYPSYWGMKAFAEVAHGKTRVQAKTEPAKNWYMLATREESGKGHLLIAGYRAENCTSSASEPLKVKILGGMRPVKVKVLNDAVDYEETTDWQWDDAKKELRLGRIFGESVLWHIILN